MRNWAISLSRIFYIVCRDRIVFFSILKKLSVSLCFPRLSLSLSPNRRRFQFPCAVSIISSCASSLCFSRRFHSLTLSVSGFIPSRLELREPGAHLQSSEQPSEFRHLFLPSSSLQRAAFFPNSTLPLNSTNSCTSVFLMWHLIGLLSVFICAMILLLSVDGDYYFHLTSFPVLAPMTLSKSAKRRLPPAIA